MRLNLFGEPAYQAALYIKDHPEIGKDDNSEQKIALRAKILAKFIEFKHLGSDLKNAYIQNDGSITRSEEPLQNAVNLEEINTQLQDHGLSLTPSAPTNSFVDDQANSRRPSALNTVVAAIKAVRRLVDSRTETREQETTR